MADNRWRTPPLQHDPYLRYTTVVVNGREERRILDYVEVPDCPGKLRRFVPKLNDGEEVQYMLGDDRAHIFNVKTR